MSSIPEDNFLTNDLFIRLCWSIYYKSSSLQIKESQFYKDVENLISLTNLNTQTLIHTLCYLYLLVNHKRCLYSSSSSSPSSSKLSSFQTSSRLKLLSSSNRKNDVELFELLVILFMISNKANDDSSYTLKTWSNLTPLTNTTLKKKELVVLKKIQYNVFLKNDEYTRWCGDVYKIGVGYQLIWNTRQQSISISSPSLYNYPPTPKSPVPESYLPPPPQMSLQQPTYQVLQPIPITQLPQQSYYSTTSSYPPQKRSFNEFNSQTPYNNVSKKQQYESVYNTPTKIASISNYNMLTPIKSSYMTSNNHNTGVMIDNNYPINYNIQPPPQQQHPLNCSCCALTNFTNCYHSSLKSMVKL